MNVSSELTTVGQGGGDSEVNGLDRYCHIHDLCYNQFHVDAGANFPHSGITLSSAQVAGIRGCKIFTVGGWSSHLTANIATEPRSDTIRANRGGPNWNSIKAKRRSR
jgi:hypothetical protein